MSIFAEDISLEILARLPVKSILTCKCVCKFWFELISKPSFVEIHLNHAKQINNTKLMLTGFDSRGENIIYSVSYDSLLLSATNDHIVKIDCPFNVINSSYDLIGSCNGLVFLRSWRYPSFVYIIWNPATKDYKKIPNPTNKHIHGFGYDRKSDDYKVISFSDLDKPKGSSSVEVYSLKSNSWNSYQTVPYKFHLPSNQALASGALHWFIDTPNRGCSSSIISFDISGENFSEVPQTEELLGYEWTKKTMGVLDECLCVVVRNFNFITVKYYFEIWVMRDYGVRESWTKLQIIYEERIINRSLRLQPMWSFKKGGEILFWSSNNSNLELHDPKHGSVNELKLGDIEFDNAINYFESLVSVNSYAYAGGNQNQE